MIQLNKYASQICRKYPVHACTDVTGFSFLGHLHEMLDEQMSAEIEADRIPVISGAMEYADEFLLTAAGQRNRNHVGSYVQFENVTFAMEEVLFDPQTSGGLLIAAAPDRSEELLAELKEAGLPAAAVGTLTEKREKEIYVRGQR